MTVNELRAKLDWFAAHGHGDTTVGVADWGAGTVAAVVVEPHTVPGRGRTAGCRFVVITPDPGDAVHEIVTDVG